MMKMYYNTTHTSRLFICDRSSVRSRQLEMYEQLGQLRYYNDRILKLIYDAIAIDVWYYHD